MKNKLILIALSFSLSWMTILAQLASPIPVGGEEYLDFNGFFADINSDGFIDYVGQGYRTMAWVENDGTGKMTTHHNLLSFNPNLANTIKALLDIDGDGDSDILVQIGTNKLLVYENINGTGQFNQPYIYFESPFILGITTNKFDNEVVEHIIVTELKLNYQNESDTTRINILTKIPNDTIPQIEKIDLIGLNYIPSGSIQIQFEDMNNDEHTDILFSTESLREIYLITRDIINQNWSISGPIHELHNYPKSNFKANDFDNDGDTDLVFWAYGPATNNYNLYTTFSGNGGTLNVYSSGYHIRYLKYDNGVFQLDEVLSENYFHNNPELRFYNEDGDDALELYLTSKPMTSTGTPHTFIMQYNGLNWVESEPLAAFPSGAFINLDSDPELEILIDENYYYDNKIFKYKTIAQYNPITHEFYDPIAFYDYIVLNDSNLELNTNKIFIDYNEDGLEDLIYWNGPIGTLNIHHRKIQAPYFHPREVILDLGYQEPLTNQIVDEKLYGLNLNNDTLIDIVLYSAQRNLLGYILNNGDGVDSNELIPILTDLSPITGSILNIYSSLDDQSNPVIYIQTAYEIYRSSYNTSNSSFLPPTPILANFNNYQISALGFFNADQDEEMELMLVRNYKLFYLESENGVINDNLIMTDQTIYGTTGRIVTWYSNGEQVLLFQGKIVRNIEGQLVDQVLPYSFSPQAKFIDFDLDGYIDAVTSQGVFYNIEFFNTSNYASFSLEAADNYMFNVNNDQYFDALTYGHNNTYQYYIRTNSYTFPKIIGGKVYYDENQNGQFDPLEQGFGGLHIMNSENNYHLCTNGNGDYQLTLSSSTVSLSTEYPQGEWIPTSPNPLIYDNTQPFNPATSLNQNFGFYPTTPKDSVVTLFYLETILCNQPINLSFHFQNYGSTLPDGKLVVVVDSIMHFQPSNSSLVTESGDSLIYYFDNLPYFNYNSANFYFDPIDELNTGLQINIKYFLYLKNQSGEYVLYDQSNFDNTLFCSYDPNDIAVSPTGYDTPHYTSYHEPLVYKIRFQNTGNYMAARVRITDVIDTSLLDVRTLLPLESTHTCFVGMEGNLLTADFPNINLPDSTSDLEGSQGYIIFSMRPKKKNTEMQILSNQAYIYFDYNSPVITNIVYNTLVDTLPIITCAEPYFYTTMDEGENTTFDVELKNEGYGLLYYNVLPSHFPPWLSILEDSLGTIEPRSSKTIQFNINTTDAIGGLLQFPIYFYNNAQNDQHLAYRVKVLNLLDTPLEAIPNTIDFTNTLTNTVQSDTIYVFNHSNQNFEVTNIVLDNENISYTINDTELGRRDTLIIILSYYSDAPSTDDVNLYIETTVGNLLIPIQASVIQLIPYISYTPSSMNITINDTGTYVLGTIEISNAGINEFQAQLINEGVPINNINTVWNINGNSLDQLVLNIETNNLVIGDNYGTITITNNSQNQPIITIPYHIVYQPDLLGLLFTPELVDFGTLNEDEIPVFTGVVTNNGSETITIFSSSSTLNGITMLFESTTLEPGQSTDYLVAYYGGLLTTFSESIYVTTSNGIYYLAVIGTEDDGKKDGDLLLNNVVVYPNPCSDYLIIKPQLGDQINDCVFRLTDIKGTVIMEGIIEANKQALLSLKNLNEGMIIVELVTNGNTEYHKIVKQ